MKTYLIEMPDDWFPARAIGRNAILANAKEVVKVKESEMVEQWEKHHLDNDEWIGRTEVSGRAVTLYAVEEK